MSTVAVLCSNATSEGVAGTRLLGPGCDARSGTGSAASPVSGWRIHQIDVILVGTGSNRSLGGEVATSRDPGETLVDVRPGVLPRTWPGGLRLVTGLGIARRARLALWVARASRRMVPWSVGGSRAVAGTGGRRRDS